MEQELDKFGRPLPKKQREYYIPRFTADSLVFRELLTGFMIF